MAGGGDFLAGAALGAALVRLEEAGVLDVFFLGSAFVSGRFLFRLEAGRVVSVSAAFALDFDLLTGALASAGSAAGRRELRRFVAGGVSSPALVRLAGVAALVFASSAGAVPERVRERVDGLAGSVVSPAFGVAGAVPR